VVGIDCKIDFGQWGIGEMASNSNIRSDYSDMTRSGATALIAHTKEAASRVLEAERSALAQIEQSAREASQLIALGTIWAEQVQQRTEARIARLRQRMRQSSHLREERILKELAALDADLAQDVPAPTTLDSALRQIADELVGRCESG
jgi:hypothetical protein